MMREVHKSPRLLYGNQWTNDSEAEELERKLKERKVVGELRRKDDATR